MRKIIIVGGGLVGPLEACYMAKKGFQVEVYEKKPDIRKRVEGEEVRGRSINLTLSERGSEALERVGLKEDVLNYTIPVYARMIHNRDGKKWSIPYGKSDQCINSIERDHLNKLLLTGILHISQWSDTGPSWPSSFILTIAAETHPDVTFHFDHKLRDCDFGTGTLTFKRTDGSIVQAKGDLIIGCDGAFSTVRHQMMKKSLFDYEHLYIPHRYMELRMPPTESDEFAMEKDYLHIWPRDEYMMIALPNLDKSFTLALFMPSKFFENLNTEENILTFFQDNFEDSIPLIGRENLVRTVKENVPLPMISVKCSPYHVRDKAVILGDAAHAMVPFYGQGMNCGFEDCIVLDDLLTKHDNRIGEALSEYTDYRSVDAKAMCDLSLRNYIEIRQRVNSWSFLLRKTVDDCLYWLLPSVWVPLYTSVSFSRMRYHVCIKDREWQDRIIKCSIYTLVSVMCVGGYLIYSYLHQKDV